MLLFYIDLLSPCFTLNHPTVTIITVTIISVTIIIVTITTVTITSINITTVCLLLLSVYMFPFHVIYFKASHWPSDCGSTRQQTVGRIKKAAYPRQDQPGSRLWKWPPTPPFHF